MNVCYLTWGETPRSYGVFGSQVLGQFIETSKIMPDDTFSFISAVPIIHSGLIREKFDYKNELELLKNKLKPINFYRLPIYAPQNFVNSTQFTFNFMHSIAHSHLKKIVKKINPEVVHCRSYHAAWAALSVKERNDFDYKIVFDARGIWPEEVGLKNGFSGSSYDFLKKIESKLLQHSDIIIAVSDTMKKYFLNLGAKRVETIYLSTSTDKLMPRKENVNSVLNFCYVGALSNSTWHKIDELYNLFSHIRSCFDSVKFTIVTTSSHSDIRSVFLDFTSEELEITSTKGIGELQEKLSMVDFGVMSYFNPSNDKEMLLGNMVMAVKTAEYVAAGLPMIVNKYCGGAASVIKENELGIAYDPNTFNELSKDKILSSLHSKTKLQRNEIAKELFDYKSNARKYKIIYKKLSC